tara:strand:+ start:11752 stop:12318 length:567 start_codon:yes stop_codon:yes gene_type:complete
LIKPILVKRRGSKRSHLLYESWRWYALRSKLGICIEWKQDFWLFVDAVGERPPNHKIHRLNFKLPLGPDNWEWKEKINSAEKAAYAKAWRANNPRASTSAGLKKKYGISIDDYDLMYKAQKGLCAICKQVETTTRSNGARYVLSVDHCHTTGLVRALLCTHCNTALGGFKENIKTLKSAIKYIRLHQP